MFNENEMKRKNTISYSKSEIKLINHYGYSDIMDSIEVISLYQLMVEKAFIDNDTSEYADALRVVYDGFTNKKIDRMTEEFDKIIENILYTPKIQIENRGVLIGEYWVNNVAFMLDDIEAYDGDDEHYGFKWTQLVAQELSMYNRMNEQVCPNEFDDLCIRRGFSLTQKDFIIDCMKHIGLGEALHHD